MRLRSGVSVVLGERPFVASVDVRGGAPGTRDTDLLDPSCRVDRVDAICLSGGSAYGLSSADGVMRWLRERGRGLAVGGAVVPIVPTAILFDLLNGGDKDWDWPPYRELAYQATGARGARLRARAMPAPAWAPRRATSRAGWAAPRRSIRRPACRSARWSR